MQSIILSAIKRHYNALLHPLHELKHCTYVLFYELKNKIQLVSYRQLFKILVFRRAMFFSRIVSLLFPPFRTTFIMLLVRLCIISDSRYHFESIERISVSFLFFFFCHFNKK